MADLHVGWLDGYAQDPEWVGKHGGKHTTVGAPITFGPRFGQVTLYL